MNVFSDPTIKAQQDQLNAQWVALNQTVDNCGLNPSSGPAFQQFYADFHSWQEFYASGNDWSSASRNATNDWQRKLQEHSATINRYCSVGWDGSTPYIPAVEDPGPDEGGLFEDAKNLAKKPFEAVDKLVKTLGIVIAGVVLLVAAILVYTIYRGIKVTPTGASVG